MIALFDIIIIAAVIASLLVASINDIKKREVPNWISYGLLFFIFATRILESIVIKDPKYIYLTFLYFIIFAIFGNIMYFARQWGGGDTKLIFSLGAAFGVRPFYMSQPIMPLPLILVTNLLVVGALYGLFYAVVLAFNNRKGFIKEFVKMNQNPRLKKAKIIILILAISVVGISFMYPLGLFGYHIGILSILMLLMPYLFTFIKSVELSCMYKKIPVSKLTEGDWVENDVYKNNKLLYKVNPYGISKEQIKSLKKMRMKEVLVKEGIQFIPSFLLGTIVTLILGNILFFSSILP